MTSGSGPVAGWASEAAVVPIEPRALPATTRRRPLRVRPVPVLRQVHHHFRLHPPAAQTTRHRARVGRPGRQAGMGPRSRTPPSHRPAHRAAARRPRSTHRSRHTGGDVTHSGHDPEPSTTGWPAGPGGWSGPRGASARLATPPPSLPPCRPSTSAGRCPGWPSGSASTTPRSPGPSPTRSPGTVMRRGESAAATCAATSTAAGKAPRRHRRSSSPEPAIRGDRRGDPPART
jgi:hypothetical protein